MAVFVKKINSVDVRMIITEEKILSNLDKLRKLVNPKSKKKIIKLENDTYFRDLLTSVTQYLREYPVKDNFPASVYKEAYSLVEYVTSQFEANNREVEALIKQREINIKTAILLKEAYETVKFKEAYWMDKLERYEGKFTKTIAEALTIIANDSLMSKEEIESAEKVIKSKISNLETNLFIEIDVERVEDRIKALSHIGIEIAEALKKVPTPAHYILGETEKQNINEAFETEKEEAVTIKIESIKEEPKEEINNKVNFIEDKNEISKEISNVEKTQEIKEKEDNKDEKKSTLDFKEEETFEEEIIEKSEDKLEEKKEEKNFLVSEDTLEVNISDELDEIDQILKNKKIDIEETLKVKIVEEDIKIDNIKEFEEKVSEETQRIELISEEIKEEEEVLKFKEETSFEVKKGFFGIIADSFKALFGLNKTKALVSGIEK